MLTASPSFLPGTRLPIWPGGRIITLGGIEDHPWPRLPPACEYARFRSCQSAVARLKLRMIRVQASFRFDHLSTGFPPSG